MILRFGSVLYKSTLHKTKYKLRVRVRVLVIVIYNHLLLKCTLLIPCLELIEVAKGLSLLVAV
jgi:hypothetical protein